MWKGYMGWGVDTKVFLLLREAAVSLPLDQAGPPIENGGGLGMSCIYQPELPSWEAGDSLRSPPL